MKPLRQFERSLLQQCTAVLFVLLMLGFGFVQAVHVHDARVGQNSPASHCSLCVVAHSGVLLAPATVAPTQVSDSTKVAELETQLQSHLHDTHSNIRPPPQNL
jgi:hypothetical protein